jgi:hypothetical protein
MGYDRRQFEDLIERVLSEFGLRSESAVNLLLGTAAQESRFGTYLRQLGGGPALGAFQMERPTFEWLRGKYCERFDFQDWYFECLEWDLTASIVFARLRYYCVASPLPSPDDVAGLAAYWKRHYNTFAGKGTEAEFIENYRRFVAGA